MTALLLALVAAATPVPGETCVYEAVPAGSRGAIADAVLAKRLRGSPVEAVLQKATDGCARQHGWTVQQALHANGHAMMRVGAERIAEQLGRPGWSGIAMTAVRLRPREQLETLVTVGKGKAEFELVLTHMIAADRGIAAFVDASDNATVERFILMIKLLAVGELERLRLAEAPAFLSAPGGLMPGTADAR
ncbi:hypothetical protein E2493_13760 [Sphingomonas parva]|uniref:Uncharacterized protein n=1 Tax=Sphingomonas parva TaxID=2555898 RepID=A0A4Y8ZSD8_9SPHN|nr:hypothetical protein [Sphingomonas parva]TFI57709.1 hypothetical protein E2493_13760 [Sphingomonas parva]